MTADRSWHVRTLATRVRIGFVALVGAALATAGVVAAPTANAFLYGNYALNIEGRYDFHTWIWAIYPCQSPGDCLYVSARAQPIAKAYSYIGSAPLANGQYTLVVDDPFGLRCDNVYYGPTIPTHDVYTWDAVTLAGSMASSFDTGCGGAPGGTFTYPFSLARM
jgi:hypothetical protein